MRSLITTLSLMILTAKAQINPLYEEFNRFIGAYDKKYLTKDEYDFRFKISQPTRNVDRTVPSWRSSPRPR